MNTDSNLQFRKNKSNRKLIRDLQIVPLLNEKIKMTKRLDINYQ